MTQQAPIASAPGEASAAYPRPLPPSQTYRWRRIWLGLVLIAAAASAITFAIRPDPATTKFTPIFALLVCFLAAGFDSATARIPNAITYTAIAAGLGINAAAWCVQRLGGPDLPRWLGSVGPLQSLEGLALCTGVGILCLSMAGMGGGDAKLLMALGTILGFSQVAVLLLWVLLLAVPYALINLVLAGRLNGLVRALAAQLLQIIYLKRLEPVAPPSRTTIPLAVPAMLAFFCMRLLPPNLLSNWIGAH